MRMRPIILGLAALMGLGGIANGLFMLLDPANWYFAVPGVTSTGAFNQHFVRDIGMIFLLLGAAMLAGVVRHAVRPALWGTAAVWLAGHAAFHLWEVAAGVCGTDALLRDFPAVTLPAIVATALAGWAYRDARRPFAGGAIG